MNTEREKCRSKKKKEKIEKKRVKEKKKSIFCNFDLNGRGEREIKKKESVCRAKHSEERRQKHIRIEAFARDLPMTTS